MTRGRRPWAAIAGGLVCWVAVVAVASPAAAQAGGSTRAQIEQVLEQQVAAWNRGDLETFCSHYAEQALFLSYAGVTRGRQALYQRYVERYPDRKAMGRLSLEILELLPIPGPTSRDDGSAGARGVSVAARWTLRFSDRDDASGLTLIVFHRQGDRWVIVQDASM